MDGPGTGGATAPTTAADGAVPRRAWLALTVTTLVFFLVVIDISAVNVAFPSIGESFDADETSLSWIISGYNITVAALLLVAGRLADSWGRRRVFMPGIAIFMIGSILCGLAPSAGMLITARVIQAIGGAIISPTALAVVLPEFPAAKRSTAIGLMGATGGLGGVFGPALGSLVIDLWSWRGIFLINVPICLVVLVAAPRLLRESKNPNATGRIDLLGVPIGTAAIAVIMFAIVESEHRGLGDPRVLALFVVGIVLLVSLVRRSSRHPEPLIELGLFRHRSYWSTNVAVAFYALAFTSGFLVNSLLLQQLWDQPITTTGQALLLSPLLAAVSSPLSGRLADRVGHRWILTVGSTISAVGYLLFILVLDDGPHVFDHYVPISALIGIGTGMTIATWASAGLSDIAPEQFGTANATLRTTQQVFFAIGIAVVVTLLTAGGGSSALPGYRWAWTWVAVCYALAAALVAVTFPAGSSRHRLAVPSAPVVARRAG
ncbi:MAG: MFS transporter [Acidimicrobiales bacterium]